MNRKRLVSIGLSAALVVALFAVVSGASGLYGNLSKSYLTTSAVSSESAADSSEASASFDAVISSSEDSAVSNAVTPDAAPAAQVSEAAEPQDSEAPEQSSSADPTPAQETSSSPNTVSPSDTSSTTAVTSSQQSAAASKTTVSSKPVNYAPDFTVYDANGNAVKLSDFRGKKPVVINFWASWCSYCKSEMPYFNQAYLKYKDSVEFLFVDRNGNGETQAAGLSYLKNNGYSFTTCFDSNGQAADAYGVSGIPASFFISKSGERVASHSGYISSYDILESYISQIAG